MGKPVRIIDLAKRMIQLSGAKNVEVRFTGLRAGEKLYEEVLNDEEITLLPSIRRSRSPRYGSTIMIRFAKI